MVSRGAIPATGTLRAAAVLVWPQLGDKRPLADVDVWPADLLDESGHIGIASGHRLLRGSANLSGAKLRMASLVSPRFNGANLSGAQLDGAKLISSNFMKANLEGADLSNVDLSAAVLINTNLAGANLTGCRVYGTSVWETNLTRTIQNGLIVSQCHQPDITTDDLEVAQFIYLLLNNQKTRHVIDTITSKVVLILGRFTPERKPILDAIRDELRKRDYLPVMFDFDKPSNRTTFETVSTLAHMARFVIADITDAKSVLQELQGVVPSSPSVPVQPVLLNSQTEPGMFDFFRMYPWVLEPYLYEDQNRLVAALNDKVIGPAEAKAKEQTGQ